MLGHFMTLGHVEIPTKTTTRGFITRRESIEVIGEDPRHYDSLIALALHPETIEFLINNLPHDDGFTKELVELRDHMKELLWTRTVG